MRNTPVVGHALRIVEDGQHPAPASETPRARLGLTWLDRLPLDALVSGDATRLVEEVRASAEALTGDDADAARLRAISRLVSATRAQVVLLETMLAERLTGLPMLFVGTTTLTAGYQSIFNFLKLGAVAGLVDALCTIVLMLACVCILGEAAMRWFKLRPTPRVSTAS
ncbi:MAG TPA: hypothetical protein VH877_18395 [Polyangia bacterium]|jgi:energy-converting hydrogenase Eha subunit C|nr:hypothetical protein [Polyangia bacterium]